MWVDCVSKKIVGHVPLNWSKVTCRIFQISNHHVCLEVSRKSQPWRDARVITWVKNSLEKLDNELHVKVKKCVS